MKLRLALAIACTAAIVSPLATAQSNDEGAKVLQAQEYCYAVAGMANMTVLNRNAGKTLDEQLALRKTSLGEGSAEYKLAADIASQVYEKDLKAPLPVATDVLRGCLEARGAGKLYSRKATEVCPAIGLLVAEVSAARSRGATAEQVAALVGDRYGRLSSTYGGGLEKLSAKYAEGAKPDNGSLDYTMCMIQGMSGAR
ncbi:hypothetical protein [Caldimonas sp. KR1-144]|uniref:hypothetical protein n=1 Tax=Caldimonas sp. KR1-144 TaxID=3400911 RepID=UPI003C06B827